MKKEDSKEISDKKGKKKIPDEIIIYFIQEW